MATVKRTSTAAIEQEVQERVGKGNAKTVYKVPISRPANVVEKQADPETLRLYTSANLEHTTLLVTGFGAYLLVTAAVALVGNALVKITDYQFSLLVVVLANAAGIAALLMLARAVWEDAMADGISISDVIMWVSVGGALALIANAIWGDAETSTLIVLASIPALLTPWSTPRIKAGLQGINLSRPLRDVLYTHYEQMEVEYSEPVVPRGDMLDGELLMMDVKADNSPLFGGKPYLLFRQVEDFCAVAFEQRMSAAGNWVSGLSRNSMLGEKIGPPDNTVPGYPKSHIEVTRGTYDRIINGLVGVGLVQIAPVGTVWSKIDSDSEYTSGFTMEEISRRLQQYAFQAVERKGK